MANREAPTPPGRSRFGDMMDTPGDQAARRHPLSLTRPQNAMTMANGVFPVIETGWTQ